MSTINTIPTFENFTEFYQKAVEPLKQENIAYIRLDGKLKGGTRNIFAYFWYNDKKWSVSADTFIDRLKIAFELAQKTAEPFVIKATRDHKGESLSIKGQPIRNNKFSVYKVGER
ncbi:hypothetical protein [Pedobacter sp. FW305-3-2-15-E-R2A2]|uniref:hypothetical protein n=1 Tax=Pedobacter sp. FW305-3-2-15-E-R2A2 TaxID=3140251 RepID=UPI0031404F75